MTNPLWHRITRTLCTAGALLLCGESLAQTIWLSDYLGAPSGSAATASNPPYTTVVATFHGFGVDSPGNWASSPISFADAGVFTKAIGAHPMQFQEARIEFNLDALRADGLAFDIFSARVGIDQTTAGINGARFNVYLDGALAQSVLVPLASAPSVAITLAVGSAMTLGLGTDRVQDGLPWQSNHTAWGAAALTPIPEPQGVVLLAAGLALTTLMAQMRTRRRAARAIVDSLGAQR